MSVATASAVLRVRLTSTISRALPRVTAASAMALPTFPVPTMPSFMSDLAIQGGYEPMLGTRRCPPRMWLCEAPTGRSGPAHLQAVGSRRLCAVIEHDGVLRLGEEQPPLDQD